jgi:spermidine synthase
MKRAGLRAAVALLAVAGAAQADELRLIHQERSLYRQVLVYERAGERCLCFTRQCTIGRQSCVELAHPQKLVFGYTRMMLGALLMGPAPQRILVVGLGGGTLPGTLARLLPAADIDAVEIDPAVVRVAGDYFSFQPGPRMHVSAEDGRTFVRRMGREGKHYDLVMLDAYDQQYIPEHMLTVEFLQEVRALLAPGGVVAANTFSASRLYDNESVTYAKVYGSFYNLRSGNRVILARAGGLPSLADVRAAAERLAPQFAPLGVDAQSLLALFHDTPDWDASARLLTDQYSPANLLNAR